MPNREGEIHESASAGRICRPLATPGPAEILRAPAAGDVGDTMDALEAAVDAAGATDFAPVDHAGGTAAAGWNLPAPGHPSFGNARTGTPAMQDDPLPGPLLPLEVLVHKDAKGKVWLACERPRGHVGRPRDHPGRACLAMVAGAPEKLTAAASGG